MKVCCFKLQSLYIIVITKQTMIWIHICCLSTCCIFHLCRLLCWGACTLAYKAQRPKMQKLAYWKSALSIRKQNSSHLQDICNAFSTKDLSSSWVRVRATSTPAHLFAKEEDKNFFFNFSGDEVESQGVFVAINITISTFSL